MIRKDERRDEVNSHPFQSDYSPESVRFLIRSTNDLQPSCTVAWARNLPPDIIPPSIAPDSTDSNLTLPPTALLLAQEKDTSWWSFTLPHRNHHRAHTVPDHNEKLPHHDDDQEDRNSRISDYFGDIMNGSRRSSRAGSTSHSHFRGNTREDRGDRNSVTQAHFSQNQAQVSLDVPSRSCTATF